MPLVGEFFALLTAILWSGTSIVFTEASVRVGSLYVNITRLLLAVIYLSVTIIVFNLSINLSVTQVFNLILSGFAGLVIGDTFLFKSFQHIGARLSMLVMALAPGISAILAFIFLDEVISFIGVMGMVITISGIAMVVLQRKEKPTSNYKVDNTGIVYALIGAIGQAVGLIFAKLAFNEGEINGFVAANVRITSSIIFLYPLFLFAKRIKNPFTVFKNNNKALVLTIIGSIIGPFLGITFSLISVSHAKVGIASTLMATVPIIMLPMVRYYYKENLSWISIVGAFIAVGGIAILFLR
ncbi:MAG: DMT family transporter [Melioribacter sp.]|nr:DMT family transporter [Melioribacter sp.]